MHRRRTGERLMRWALGSVNITIAPSKNCPDVSTRAMAIRAQSHLALPRGQAALANLEMADGRPQYRRGDSKHPGAVQHVAQNLLAFGACAGLEVAQHRCAEFAASLGQHRPSLIALLRSRWIRRGCRDGLAFGE